MVLVVVGPVGPLHLPASPRPPGRCPALAPAAVAALALLCGGRSTPRPSPHALRSLPGLPAGPAHARGPSLLPAAGIGFAGRGEPLGARGGLGDF